MRQRHIKNAETDIYNYPNIIKDPLNKANSGVHCFNNDHPLYIEIGMGKGKFIKENAVLHPDFNYIGIERSATIMMIALERSDEEICNLKYICCDADNINDIFNDQEIDKIYLNFSDPWPKSRHYKRRLTYRERLNQYAQVLKDDGSLEFRTDNRGLFQWSLTEFSHSDLILEEVSLDFHHDYDNIEATTEYEDKFSALGNPIYYLKAVKKHA